MKVAVLGCGPAGLVATHAAVQAGADVSVFSRLRKSELFGAQYLHEPIPGIDPGVPQQISYQLLGSVDDYRLKVYGSSYNGPVSPGSLEPGHKAFDIRHTYDQLWDRYVPLIRNVHVNKRWLGFRVPDFDMVISTVPLPDICRKPHHHRFHFRAIMALGDAPARGQLIPRPFGMRQGDVVCNGLQDPSWYRASLIFDHATLEWAPCLAESSIPESAAEVLKPLDNSCDCWPEFVLAGRYGKWQKGVLVHHAYQEVAECLASL
jgi:hypothetical protein